MSCPSAKPAILAVVAQCEINNLRVINTALRFNSVPGHHVLKHLQSEPVPTCGTKFGTGAGVLVQKYFRIHQSVYTSIVPEEVP